VNPFVVSLLVIATLVVGVLVGRASARRSAELATSTTASRDRVLEETSGEARFAAVPAVALVVDAEGRIAAATTSALERFPFLREGMTLLEAFSQHLLTGPVRAAVEHMQPEVFHVRLFADGARRFRATVVPYAASKGRHEAILMLDDQTEESSYQELRSQFVANVSHELRTPLAGLSVTTETLAKTEPDPETRSRFVERARRETARLSALIRDTLFLSELEARGVDAGDDNCDLAAVVSDVADEYAERAAQVGVVVASETSTPCWATIGGGLAHTVAANLIENAIRYSGQGSHVTARVESEGDWVTFSVIDDGVGIDQRHLPHIFERFYRVDASRSKELGGTGLGLSIVKHIADWCGGRVEAESRVGRGTVIRVTLPASHAPSPSGAHE
jgi:signal transduction histidine kinase